MKKGMNASLLLASMAALSGTWVDDDGIPIPKPKPPQFPFTEAEIEKLSTLSGKEKKLFLKKLKARYA